MTTKIKKLLAVLDMPKDKRLSAMSYLIVPKPWRHAMGQGVNYDATPESTCWGCRKCNKNWRFWNKTQETEECSIPRAPTYTELVELIYTLAKELARTKDENKR